MRVAIFDFDGTLYAKETYQVLMDHLKEHPIHNKRYKRFFRTILPPYIGSKIKIYPRQKMRARSMQIYLDALEDFTVDELDAYFKEIAEKMKKDFNPLVLDKIKQHAADGVYVMLVSGAYTPLLHIVTEGLPIDSIIGTNVPINNHILDTKLPIHHIQGRLKNEEIEATLANKKIDWGNSYAYADSYSDLSVLDLVGNPVAVQPEPQLQVVAEQRNWKII